jgi:hypothetical protein
MSMSRNITTVPLAALSADLPDAQIPGFVVMLSDEARGVSRVEALTSDTPIDAGMLAKFASILTYADTDGHTWAVVKAWETSDVAQSVFNVRKALRARATSVLR